MPRAGLEPAHLAAEDFESSVSTYFTIWANWVSILPNIYIISHFPPKHQTFFNFFVWCFSNHPHTSEYYTTVFNCCQHILKKRLVRMFNNQVSTPIRVHLDFVQDHRVFKGTIGNCIRIRIRCSDNCMCVGITHQDISGFISLGCDTGNHEQIFHINNPVSSQN